MNLTIKKALYDFTDSYLTLWKKVHNSWPRSSELLGITSPCIVAEDKDYVYWKNVPFAFSSQLTGVEQALSLVVHPDAVIFYTSQFAGDMGARFAHEALKLLQVWNENDFIRLQENLIGHLVVQRKYKLRPTIFLATTDDDNKVISLCNLTGHIVKETLGSEDRQILSANLMDFLPQLQPIL